MYRRNENIRVFPSKNIRSATADGILFTNEKEEIEFIDFKACYQAWVNYEEAHLDRYTPPMNLRTWRKRHQDWKEIGARDALNNQPFIFFYTNPQICFEFETTEEVTSFRLELWRLGGWRTFDLA